MDWCLRSRLWPGPGEQFVNPLRNLQTHRMSGSRNLTLRVNNVASGHTGDAELLRWRGSETAGASPDVDRVRPTALIHVILNRFQGVIDADGHELYAVRPTGVGVAILLHIRHRALAGPAPGRPEVEHDYFATEVGELHFLVVGHAHEFNVGGGSAGWQ